MITTSVSSISYSGNASTTTAYAFAFPLIEADDLIVTLTDAAAVVTTLASSAYTVTPTLDANGRITGGSITTATAYASTYTVNLKRVTDGVQSLDLKEGGSLNPEAIELALDRCTMIAQEAARDAVNGGTSTITASGTGLISQTAADAFSTRTITPAAESGLSITNGDGVSGAPTIDLSSTGLTVITSAADSDQVRLETTAGSEVIEVSDLLGRSWPLYKYVDIPASEFVAGGGSSGITVADNAVKFTTSATSSAFARFVLPEDYKSGTTISFKIHSYIFGGTSGDPYVVKMFTYESNGESIGSIVTTGDSIDLTHSDTDCRSTVFPCTIKSGEALAPGSHYELSLARDTADAADTASGVVYVESVRFEYQANRISSTWS